MLENINNQRLSFSSKIDRFIYFSSIGFSGNQIKKELNVSGMTLKRIRKAARERLYDPQRCEDYILMIRAAQLANYRRAVAVYSEVPIDKKPNAIRAINDTLIMMENTMSKLGLLPQEVKNIKIEGSTDMEKLRAVLDKFANDKN